VSGVFPKKKDEKVKQKGVGKGKTGDK